MKNHLFKYLIIISLIIFSFYSPFKIIIVQGNSMYPTLKNNQILIGVEAKKFKRNEIVVATFEDNRIIKRIKFIEGDVVYYRLNHKEEMPILISEKDFNNYVKKDISEIVQKYTVEKDKFFLIGDNLNFSDDSRRFGTLHRESIKYKIIFPRF